MKNRILLVQRQLETLNIAGKTVIVNDTMKGLVKVGNLLEYFRSENQKQTAQEQQPIYVVYHDYKLEKDHNGNDLCTGYCKCTVGYNLLEGGSIKNIIHTSKSQYLLYCVQAENQEQLNSEVATIWGNIVFSNKLKRTFETDYEIYYPDFTAVVCIGIK